MTATTFPAEPISPASEPPPTRWQKQTSPPDPPADPPSGGRWKPWFFRALAVVLVIAGIAFDRSALLVIPLLFAVVVPFEKLFPRHDQKIRRPDLALDVSYATTGALLSAISLVVIIPLALLTFAWLPGLAVRPLFAALPALVQLIVAFALFDLVIYWAHRWSHEVPFLWRFHSVHHSVRTMDWVSGFRNHPLDGIILAPAVAFLIGAGISLEVTGVFAVVQIIIGIFLHANVRWRLRPLQRFIITPEFHHWHHANEPDAINHNYSVFLPLWDIMFGTWFMPKDRRPQVYGVEEHMPAGLIAQLLHPFRGLRNPLRVLRHPITGTRETLRILRRGAGQIRKSTTRPTSTRRA